jgi:hypothetical protein
LAHCDGKVVPSPHPEAMTVVIPEFQKGEFDSPAQVLSSFIDTRRFQPLVWAKGHTN